MGGPLKLAEKMPGLEDMKPGENVFLVKPTEITLLDPLEANPQGLGGATLQSPPPSLMLSDGVYNDTLPAPLDLNVQPVGALAQFADFSHFAVRIVDEVTHTSPEEIYDGIISGSLNLLRQAAPNFGGLCGLIGAGLDVFADLQIPGSGRLFSRFGKPEFFLGKGTNIGFDRIQSDVMQPKHVKISEGASGLQFEDISGSSASNVWIGEKVPGTERYEWTRLKPGVPHRPKGGGMIQVAVGPISLNDAGVPIDFKGSEHLGINGFMGERRIFRME